jgi:hypothetical protein
MLDVESETKMDVEELCRSSLGRKVVGLYICRHETPAKIYEPDSWKLIAFGRKRLGNLSQVRRYPQ